MVTKTSQRTAQRILRVSLDLFNRFGEPNVSTAQISNELSISPGNLYYHFSAKDALVNVLFDELRTQLKPVLDESESVPSVAQAHQFVAHLLDLAWQYRFLYRDLNDLLSKNRHLEAHFQWVLKAKVHAFGAMLEGLRTHGLLHWPDKAIAHSCAVQMMLTSSYWLCYEYVCNPRQAMEEAHKQPVLQRATWQTVQLLHPFLSEEGLVQLKSLHPEQPSEAA